LTGDKQKITISGEERYFPPRYSWAARNRPIETSCRLRIGCNDCYRCSSDDGFRVYFYTGHPGNRYGNRYGTHDTGHYGNSLFHDYHDKSNRRSHGYDTMIGSGFRRISTGVVDNRR